MLERFDPATLDPEDVEDDDIHVKLSNNGLLEDDDLLQFISVYFSDEYGTKNRTEPPDTGHYAPRTLWVENAKTGELMPVTRRNISSGGNEMIKEGKEGRGDELDTERLGDEEGIVEAEYSSLLPLPRPLLDAEELDFEDTQYPYSGMKNGDDNDFSSLAASITGYYSNILWQRVFFLFFQGLLAGFVFTIVYSQETYTSDGSLLGTYQPNAQEYRRFLYILSATSVIGCWDQLLTLLNSRRKKKLHTSGANVQIDQFRQSMVTMNNQGNSGTVTISLTLAILSCVLYSIVYLCTVLMGQMDVLIATKNGSTDNSESDAWSTEALADSDFSSEFSTWKDLNRARFLAAVVGWIVCCILICLDLTTVFIRGEDLYRVRDNLSIWMRRVRVMEGSADSGIEQMSGRELRRLVNILQIGLDRSREALSYHEDDERLRAEASGEVRPG